MLGDQESMRPVWVWNDTIFPCRLLKSATNLLVQLDAGSSVGGRWSELIPERPGLPGCTVGLDHLQHLDDLLLGNLRIWNG